MALKVGQLLQTTIEAFKSEGIESARLDALLLFEYALSKDRTYILVHDDDVLTTDQVRLLSELTDRRLAHEPIAYIVGYREFYGLSLTVTKDVLIPRPESEAIVEYIQDRQIPTTEVLDVGTGSGALAIAIAHSTEHSVSACDISEAALEVARNNAETHGTDILFYTSDLLADIDAQYGIIVANLPYVPSEQALNTDAEFEPDMALFSGKDGLDHYRKLFKQLPDHLLHEATVLIEHQPEQLQALKKLAKGYQAESVSDYVTAFKKLD